MGRAGRAEQRRAFAVARAGQRRALCSTPYLGERVPNADSGAPDRGVLGPGESAGRNVLRPGLDSERR